MFDLRSLILATAGSGLICRNYGPYAVDAALDGSAAWLEKGLDIPSGQARLNMPWDFQLDPSYGCLTLFIKLKWSYNDGQYHYFFDMYGGSNARFYLIKYNNGNTYLITNDTSRGDKNILWQSDTLYFICINWGINEIYINGSLFGTYSPGHLGSPCDNLYLMDGGVFMGNSAYCTFFLATLHSRRLTATEILALYNLYKPFFEE